MIRPLPSLELLSLDEKEGQVRYRKLTFIADKPPPPRIAYQEVLMAAESEGEVWAISGAS